MQVLALACDDLGSFDPADMILEYLDEQAGRAILDHTPLSPHSALLNMSTSHFHLRLPAPRPHFALTVNPLRPSPSP